MLGFKTEENVIRYNIKFLEQKTKFRTFTLPGIEGVAFVRGMKGDKWETQSVVFQKENWTLARAKKWIAGHSKEIREGKILNIATQDNDLILLSEASTLNVDRENFIIRDVVILGPVSKFLDGTTRRTYSERVLKASQKLFEGIRVYANHDKESLEKGEVRDVRELVGKIENVRFFEGKLIGDLHVLKSQTWIIDIAEQMPEIVGLSINAQGTVKRKGGVEDVQRIIEVRSVDVVSEGGTTLSLFEEMEENVNPKTEEKKPMYDEINLEELRAKRPDIVTSILSQSKANAEVAELKEQVKTLTTTNDDKDAQLALIEKRTLVNKKVKDAELPDEVVSDVFVENLVLAKDAEAIDKLIEDRKALVKGAEGVADDKKVKSDEKTVLSEGAKAFKDKEVTAEDFKKIMVG